MKRLHDLRKLLPGSAKLNRMESLRLKGGSEKRRDRPSAETRSDDSGSDEGTNNQWSTTG
ncbi:MAG: hypothetical protein AAFW73_16205 [Bacteroidota bacterium]